VQTRRLRRREPNVLTRGISHEYISDRSSILLISFRVPRPHRSSFAKSSVLPSAVQREEAVTARVATDSPGDITDMKKPKTTTYLIMAFVICALTAVVVISIGAVKAQKPQAQNNGNDDETARLALRRGGLRAAAKIKGHYTTTFDPNWDLSNFDIESLAKHSAAVVIGSPTTSKSQLTADGLLVITEYEVSIREVLKGTIPPNNTVKVTVPGGKVEFEDGTSAEVITPEEGHLTISGSYVFFLHQNADGGDTYRLTGGPQGLIEFPTDGGHVKSHGRSTDAVVKETKEDNVRSLHDKVRKAAEKWPQPGNCCS
jgi:hypothetical protein